MAIRGLSLSENNWYVCRGDPGKRDTLEESREAGATIFFFTAIPNRIMAVIHDMQQSASVEMGEHTTQTFHQKTAGKNREAFMHGVTGWENFFDDNDEPIKCEHEQRMHGITTVSIVSEQSMNRVRLATINEVGAHVFNTNSLGDEDRKKFEALLSHFENSGDGTAETAMTVQDESGDAQDQQNISGDPSMKPQQLIQKPAKSIKPKLGTGKTPRPNTGKTGAHGG